MTKTPYIRFRRLISPTVILPVLIALCSFSMPARTNGNAALKANRNLLQRLDSLITNHPRIIEKKENRINGLRTQFLKAGVPRNKFDLAWKLYQEYQVYNPDSAMAYANIATKLASLAYPGDINRQAACRLNQIFIYATQGFGQDATDMLETLDPSTLSNEMKIQYYQVGQYIHSNRALFNNSARYCSDPHIIRANAYRDSLVRLDPDHTREVIWAPIAMQLDKEGDDYHVDKENLERLEKSVENQTESTRENAINAYWLGRHYGRVGDDTKMVRYMTLAATYDAEIENREIAAITELASWLFENGDLDRAYTYLIYSSDQANSYRNRARVLNVGTFLPSVRDAYTHEIIERDHRLRVYLIGLIVLAVILIGAGIFIVLENRRLRRTRHALAESNSRLEDSLKDRDDAISALEKANKTLSEKNKELEEADKVKQGLVALSFRLASDHINALDEYRKKLLRKFKQKQYVELGAELNDQELIRDPYKDFYAAFDHTVLSIFPDFIADYKTAAPSDTAIDEEAILKNRTLNTRMRIFALRKLDVEKSADIARMLNVSIRTVYNNRS